MWSEAATRPAWASIGFLEVIARLPHPVQVEIAQDYVEAWRRPASVAEFELEIRERYLHMLKHAPWKLDDLAVLPSAQPCNVCAKRSSCQTSLFDAAPGDADRCLDAVCWGEKLNAHNASKARALAAKHPKLLVLTATVGADHHQPAPVDLPENAVALQRSYGIEDCKKTDAGAMPALDVETGKQSWVKVAAWADAKVRAKLGLSEEKPASGKSKAQPASGGAAPTAEQKREAKRLALRLRILGEEITDADPPKLMKVVRLYTVFCESALSMLDAKSWSDAQTIPEDEVRDLLWQAVTRRASYPFTVRATALPDEAAISAMERLATLDPDEQRKKALAEIPEPKRRG